MAITKAKEKKIEGRVEYKGTQLVQALSQQQLLQFSPEPELPLQNYMMLKVLFHGCSLPRLLSWFGSSFLNQLIFKELSTLLQKWHFDFPRSPGSLISCMLVLVCVYE